VDDLIRAGFFNDARHRLNLLLYIDQLLLPEFLGRYSGLPLYINDSWAFRILSKKDNSPLEKLYLKKLYEVAFAYEMLDLSEPSPTLLAIPDDPRYAWLGFYSRKIDPSHETWKEYKKTIRFSRKKFFENREAIRESMGELPEAFRQQPLL
jgi:hypothetical protein